MKKENPIRLWGPWADNPSAPENFYEANESFVESDAHETSENPSVILAKPKLKGKMITEVGLSELEGPEDPYASILKDLK